MMAILCSMDGSLRRTAALLYLEAPNAVRVDAVLLQKPAHRRKHHRANVLMIYFL